MFTSGEGAAIILETVRTFLDNGLKVEQTARHLYVHPNTLRNRLARFEQLTGADLHRIEDLVGVWWSLTYDRGQGLTA